MLVCCCRETTTWICMCSATSQPGLLLPFKQPLVLCLDLVWNAACYFVHSIFVALKQGVEGFSVFSKFVSMRMHKNAQNPFKLPKMYKKKMFATTPLFSMWKSPFQLSLEVSELISVLLNLAASFLCGCTFWMNFWACVRHVTLAGQEPGKNIIISWVRLWTKSAQDPEVPFYTSISTVSLKINGKLQHAWKLSNFPATKEKQSLPGSCGQGEHLPCWCSKSISSGSDVQPL